MYLREVWSRLIATGPLFVVRAAAGSRDAMPDSAAERVNAEPPALLAPFGAAPPVNVETMPVTTGSAVAPLDAAVPELLPDEEPVDDEGVDAAFVTVETGAETAFVTVETGAEAAFVTVETGAETALVTVATGAGVGAAGGSVGVGAGAGGGGGGVVGTETGVVTVGTGTGDVTPGTGTGELTVGIGVDVPGRPPATAVPAAPVAPISATAAIDAADLTVL